jgi:hypothetical protein
MRLTAQLKVKVKVKQIKRGTMLLHLFVFVTQEEQ